MRIEVQHDVTRPGSLVIETRAVMGRAVQAWLAMVGRNAAAPYMCMPADRRTLHAVQRAIQDAVDTWIEAGLIRQRRGRWEMVP